jgi:hypothetical protein
MVVGTPVDALLFQFFFGVPDFSQLFQLHRLLLQQLVQGRNLGNATSLLLLHLLGGLRLHRRVVHIRQGVAHSPNTTHDQFLNVLRHLDFFVIFNLLYILNVQGVHRMSKLKSAFLFFLEQMRRNHELFRRSLQVGQLLVANARGLAQGVHEVAQTLDFGARLILRLLLVSPRVRGGRLRNQHLVPGRLLVLILSLFGTASFLLESGRIFRESAHFRLHQFASLRLH